MANMIRPALALSYILFSTLSATALSRPATTAERERCEKPIEDQIRQIEDRMRTGYSGAEGNFLNDRLRELKERRARCRTVDN